VEAWTPAGLLCRFCLFLNKGVFFPCNLSLCYGTPFPADFEQLPIRSHRLRSLLVSKAKVCTFFYRHGPRLSLPPSHATGAATHALFFSWRVPKILCFFFFFFFPTWLTRRSDRGGWDSLLPFFCFPIKHDRPFPFSKRAAIPFSPTEGPWTVRIIDMALLFMKIFA